VYPTRKTFNRFTTKGSYTRNITHNKEITAVWTVKPEWRESPLVPEETKQEEKLFNYIDFSQHNDKLTTIMFTVYSDMFRLTRVIFRLELYLFTMSLCSFWDPRRLHVLYIDVIYCITIGGCSKCHCYGIVTNYCRCLYW